jgi:putative addiction module killer protein
MPRLIVVEYQTPDSRTPAMDWLRALRDDRAMQRIAKRIDRLRLGLRGDWRPVGGPVFELRIDHGPGYRIYAAKDGDTLIVLLCAGDKRTRQRDIETAHAYWKDYQARR